MFAALTALALAMPVAAQDKSRSKTYEGPNVSATQTTTANRETGTITREGTVTHRETGATATSSALRQRTDTGATVSAVQTGPGGKSRSLQGERTRTENGSTFSGTATGAKGQTYGLAGSRSRDGAGNSQASQSVTNAAGQTIAARDRVTTRGNGQSATTVTRSRPKGTARPRGRRG